jgi:hypothetical protein
VHVMGTFRLHVMMNGVDSSKMQKFAGGVITSSTEAWRSRDPERERSKGHANLA